ncbi:MAG: sodium/proton-translocating pyrophosphatase, partial [Armatimonadota bacterium]
NAAVIADNVGDNVGDCAGMAADIFESYEVTLVAAMILALAAGKPEWVVFALVVRGIGVLTSIVGTYLVKMRSETEHAMAGITRGFVWSALLSIIGFAIFAWVYLLREKADSEWWRLLLSTTAGIILAVLIYKLTEYYTSVKRAPVQEIAQSTQTGTATNILSGFAFGLESSVAAILMICAALLCGVFIFWGHSITNILFSVSLTGLGMLTTTGIIVSMDSYGPIADNANGIGEMANLEADARRRMDELDAVGNTTKAATKGFAIASAVIAAVSLFGSYMDKVVLSFERPSQVVQAFERTGIARELLDYEAKPSEGEAIELVPGPVSADGTPDVARVLAEEGRLRPQRTILRYWLDRKASLQAQLAGSAAKDVVAKGQPMPEGGGPAPQPVLQLMRERARTLEALKPPINVGVPEVFVGLLIGGAMPFLFSSLTIRAVGRAAFSIINEVRRQFREIEGLWEGKARPDSARCVDICTSAAIRELVGPGVLAILTPAVVGCFLGWPGLGGYLAGIIVTGQLLAVMLANSGGAWDNAKKFIEDGAFGGKGSDAHKAAVVGDTVGDPFIKVMNLTGVLVAPLVVGWYGGPIGWVIGLVGLVIVLAAFALSRRGQLEKGVRVEAALDSEQEQ